MGETLQETAPCWATVKKMWYMYTVDHYSAIKRREPGSFVQMWIDLESVIQSEVCQFFLRAETLATSYFLALSTIDGKSDAG